MKAVTYTLSALKDIKRHGNMAGRIRKAIEAYAADSSAHANNVTQLVGSTAKRLRVGDFRVIFEEDAETVLVTKVGPRGGVYD